MKNEMHECDACEKAFDMNCGGGSRRTGESLCENCLPDVEEICEICEESFYEPETPAETFLHIADEDASAVGAAGGIYKVNKFPWFLAAVAFGFESVITDSIERVGGSRPKKRTGYICGDCFKKYTQS